MKKRKMSLIINTLIVVLEIIGFIISYVHYNRLAFEFYTEDSNMLALIVSLLFVIFLFKKKDMPYWLRLLKYSSIICLTVTFLVVIFILAPMYKFNYAYLLLSKELLFHHFLCPILAIVSFIFFDDVGDLSLRDSLRGLSFTFLYAFILIILNIVEVIEGPYPFLKVREQSFLMSIVWFFVISGFSCFISLFLRKLYIRFSKKD